MTDQTDDDDTTKQCCGCVCCCCCCADVTTDQTVELLRGMADVLEDVLVEED